nr:hypothetical protein CFP56_09334 [Quercus suber]
MASEPADRTVQQSSGSCEDCDVQSTPRPQENISRASAATMPPALSSSATVDRASDLKLPRVAITFCTQCKWMLRAAYFGQELLSTFGSAIGEIALIPATGGLFQVNVTYQATPDAAGDGQSSVKEVLLWDRKAKGGFPETKVLKQLVRDVIEPDKGLGHSDVGGKVKAIENRTEGVVTVQDPLIGMATSGAQTPIAAPGLDIKSLEASMSVASIDPLLENASATNSVLDASTAREIPSTPTTRVSGLSVKAPAQEIPVDPLVETALTSPTSETQQRGNVSATETGGKAHVMSSFAQDAYATANAPMTWEQERSL